MNKKIERSILVVLIVWNLLLSYLVITDYFGKNSQSSETTKVVQNVTTYETDFTKVVEENSSKAVGIITYINGKEYSTGSGAIYQTDEDGVIIITNHHVIQNGTSVEVLFSNGEALEAEVVGSDVYSDIAVLRVYPEFEVEAFTLGDSSAVKVGEWVLAIGSPLGMEFYASVTAGIISGKDRTIPVDLNNDGIDDWDLVVLQTNAAINPGNSGGPLLNLNGELIGINSVKYSGDSIEGMAFSIPINEVIPIVTQLLEKGTVERPMIGIAGASVVDIPIYARSYYDIPIDLEYGVYITSLTEGGSALEAGLEPGDIILGLNEEEVTSFKEFRKILYSLESGDIITITYLRNAKEYTAEITLQ